MPFVSQEDIAVSNDRALGDLPVSRDLPTSEVVGSFLAEENVLAKGAEGLGNYLFKDFEEDPLFDPYEHMSGYEAWADDLEVARNREEMVFLKNRIDRESERAADFADGSALQKVASIGALIATDPTTLVPVGTVAYKTYRTGGRILEGAAKTAATAAAVESGREALLHLNSITRTGEESLYNVGGASLLGFVLGGAAAGLSKVEFDDLAVRFDNDMVTPESSSSLSSAGAMQSGTTLLQEEIKGLERTKKAFRRIPGFLQNPVFEGAVSESKATRELTEALSDLSLVKNKNTEFIPSKASVELRVKGYDALRVPYHKDVRAAWRSYRSRSKADLAAGKIAKEDVLDYHGFMEQAGRAARRNDQHDIPEVATVAQSARRNIFDPVLKRAEEAGVFDDIDELDVKTADSWLKRMYDTNKIIQNRTEFKSRILNYLQRQDAGYADELKVFKENFVDEIANKDKGILKQMRALERRVLRSDERIDGELDEVAEQIIDRITNVTNGRLPYDNKLQPRNKGAQKVGARGSAKSRVFNIPDEEIEDFLVSDLDAVVDAHLRTMAPDNEIMASFGSLDIDPLKKRIQEDYQALRVAAKGNNKRLAELDKKLNRDISNVEALWEKLRGIYKQPDDYAAPAHVFERGALALNFTRLLGDVVASSVPDMGRHVMVHGFSRTYGKLMRSVISDVKGLKMSAAEMEEIGLALDMTNSMTALRRANMDEYMPVTGKIDTAGRKVSQFTANFTGINIWNATQRTFAGIMSQNRMLDTIIDLSRGRKVGAKEIENLASHGIDREMAKRIAGQYTKHGEQRKVLKIANARIWDDLEAKNVLQLAVRKQVDEIIVNPGLDRPLWMSQPGWRLVGQFKSYSFASMNRVALAGLQQADAHTMQGLGSMVFLGALVYAWKTKLAGKNLSDDPRVWITEGIDRSGVTGWFFDVNNIIEKATAGRVGVNRLIGGPPMSRYASRNTAGALLGPTFGMMMDAFQVSGAVSKGEVEPSDVHAMRRLLPMQNIPYLRGMFDQLEDGLNNVFGSEEGG